MLGILLDPFLLGYYIGEFIFDAFILSTGTRGVVIGYSAIKAIARTHSLKDKSAEAITENLFECLDYLD